MIGLNSAIVENLGAVPSLKGHGFEIVRYREERGRFATLRQPDDVPRLVDRTEDVADAVTVGDAAE